MKCASLLYRQARQEKTTLLHAERRGTLKTDLTVVLSRQVSLDSGHNVGPPGGVIVGEHGGKPESEFLFPVAEYQGYKEPVLISACFLGVPCRWHGRKAKKRDALIERLKKKLVLVPVCPEQLGGMPTPRDAATLNGGTGAQVLDEGLRIVAPETGQDVTAHYVNGGRYTLEIARVVGAKRAYLKGGSPSCDREGIAGEILKRGGVKVIRVP